MTATSPTRSPAAEAGLEGDGRPGTYPDHAVRQLIRWGGISGIAGFVALLASVAVVVSLGLSDASDVETLTDFADIESGRIAEHFLYLGALLLFALHVAVLYRVLRTSHLAAALFATVAASVGYAILAASSLLHLSTSPLYDLYAATDATPEDLRAIEYAWHGAQSVFDTMLITGVLLVPIGIVLFGVAMWNAPAEASPVRRRASHRVRCSGAGAPATQRPRSDACDAVHLLPVVAHRVGVRPPVCPV